jgi:hypothetical protein
VNAPSAQAAPYAIGFTRADFMNFLALQMQTLAHYCALAKDAERDEEQQTAFNNVHDTLLELHDLVQNIDLDAGEGSAES